MPPLGVLFIVIGSNAILAYMASELLDLPRIAGVFVGGLARNLSASHFEFVKAVGAALVPFAALAMLWLVLPYLYRKGTFVRV